MTAGSRRAGRWSAWVYAVGALLGGGLVGFASSGIPPVDLDPGAHYAAVRGVWPELYAAVLVVLVAFLALMPLGLALRDRLGPAGPGSELVSAAFLAAAIVGMLAGLVQIGSAQAIAQESAGLDSAGLKALASGDTIWSGVIDWLDRGFFLPAGLGTYWAGRAALRTGSLPRSWAWLGLVISGFYGLGLASLLAQDAGLGLPLGAGGGLILLGFILSTVWAAWFGFELGRTPRGELSS